MTSWLLRDGDGKTANGSDVTKDKIGGGAEIYTRLAESPSHRQQAGSGKTDPDIQLRERVSRLENDLENTKDILRRVRTAATVWMLLSAGLFAVLFAVMGVYL